MIGQLSLLLMVFREAFPRGATFEWFVVAIFGFIVRLDHHGVSSSIRWLRIVPNSYEAFLAFFRSDALKLDKIFTHWLSLVSRHCATRTRAGAFVLIGDGIKVAKEAECMPGVKKLHQESENSSKAPWILGHHFGVLGMLAANQEKAFCIPLIAELHEGAEALRQLQQKDVTPIATEKLTVVTLMANLARTVATKLKEPCVAVLDAYFAVGPAFEIAKTLRSNKGQRLLHIITRAKNNIVACEEQPQTYSGRGRPPKHGKRIKLKALFSARPEEFTTVKVYTYGETKTLAILCLDLIWKPIKDKLRFVLVKDGTARFILICSDLTMAPQEIVELYASRFKIEVTFKMVKHIIGGLWYHFWTTAWRDPLGKSLAVEQLKDMDGRRKKLIASAMNAIEAFVNIALIATGLLQIIALEHAAKVRHLHHWWMRTYPPDVPSEEMVKTVIQHEFYHNFRKFKHTAIYRIIQAKRRHQTPEIMKMVI
ncbi:transposase [Desulfoferrobacter suflitae]|uniref:transposase n=1 Tax=Desulfoferrobacter suflitae TaxID=2865782 RepID=UPI002164652F|nr:transposase [Desulfoferrobacter suflitae]MCK8600285.1 transposase [Desulfoferrobacter suflitae]